MKLAPRFTHHAAIDWSGAAGEHHRGIAVALAGPGRQAPRLIAPPDPRGWSRPQVLEWLCGECPPNTLIGFDLGISLPFADAGAFFPGWSESPPDARALWALVERICADDGHLAAATLVNHREAARHFRRHGGRQGDAFGDPPGSGGPGRMRVTEAAQRRLGCRPTSNFNLVGAAQVGKGSLAGMRLLHRLPREIPVWPIDPLPRAPGRVVVEIYTTIAAMAAGRTASRAKMRSHEELNEGLARLTSDPFGGEGPIGDHAADAILTAAWLRAEALRPELWSPASLTPALARTEGWTFGAP